MSRVDCTRIGNRPRHTVVTRTPIAIKSPPESRRFQQIQDFLVWLIRIQECGWSVADIISKADRSALMAKVRSKNTKPEVLVRSILHRLGYRFRLHQGKLPGNPDIVLSKHRLAVFVNGCFWHQHVDCRKATRPTTNKDFWDRKLDQNVARDKMVRDKLAADRWKILDIWECELKKNEFPEYLEKMIAGRIKTLEYYSK